MPLTILICMVTAPHIMVGLERMLDYRGDRLERFHCTKNLHTLQHSLCHCTGVCVDT